MFPPGFVCVCEVRASKCDASWSQSPGCALAAHHVLQIFAESLQIMMCCHRESWDPNNSSLSHLLCPDCFSLFSKVRGDAWPLNVCECVWAAPCASLCQCRLGLEQQDSLSKFCMTSWFILFKSVCRKKHVKRKYSLWYCIGNGLRSPVPSYMELSIIDSILIQNKLRQMTALVSAQFHFICENYWNSDFILET